jgi:hypothetical protein
MLNDTMNLDPFVSGVRPFAMSNSDKASFLAGRLAVLFDYHRARCKGYEALVGEWSGAGHLDQRFIEAYPYLPVSLFKEYELKSSDDHLTVVESSSTTSKNASKIFIDKESRRLQSLSANSILTDFVGGERRPYIVFDAEETVRGGAGITARGAAILALAHLATDVHFVMKRDGDGVTLDKEALDIALSKVAHRPFIAYGFTFILYQASRELDGGLSAHPDSVFLHSGGWKKLTDLAVDKPTFNRTVSAPWGLAEGRVVDFYGMVEQIGVPYPDCPAGAKHVPYWAEVLIRRADTLEPARPGESGLIQLISALPLAAPNHSVLTEDVGRIVCLDNCPCGRHGTAFVFEGRAPKAELRGCSDVVRR